MCYSHWDCLVVPLGSCCQGCGYYNRTISNSASTIHTKASSVGFVVTAITSIMVEVSVQMMIEDAPDSWMVVGVSRLSVYLALVVWHTCAHATLVTLC